MRVVVNSWKKNAFFTNSTFWQISMRIAKNEFRNDKGIRKTRHMASGSFSHLSPKLVFYHDQSISAISGTDQAIDEPKLFVFKIRLAALFVTMSQTLTNFFQKRFDNII